MFYVVLFILAGTAGVSVLACQNSKTGDLNETATEQGTPAEDSRVVTVPLFARDALSNSLPLSISIETAAGASVFWDRGTTLPAHEQLQFSTAEDQQPSIEIHFLAGESTVVNNNISIGRFRVSVAPALAGVSTVQIQAKVDTLGNFSFDARTVGTGESCPIEVESVLSDPISKFVRDHFLAKVSPDRDPSVPTGPVPDNQNMQKIWTDSVRDRAETIRKTLRSAGMQDLSIRAMCASALAEADGIVAAHSGPTLPDGALTREQVQAFAQASEKLSQVEEALGITLEE